MKNLWKSYWTQKMHKLPIPLLDARQMPRLSLEQQEQAIGRLNAGQQLIAQAFNVPPSLQKWLHWCVQCVCACVCACHICFQLHHWLAACCENGSRVRKPSSTIIASHIVRSMWPRYENLLEVVYGNWMLRSSRHNHKDSEETRPLDARHAWPTGVWICHGVCKPSSQLWVK